jgi:hypothetical protein
MYNIINLLLIYSLFHHIGHSINNNKVFMTIIKLSVSLCCSYLYLMYTDSLVLMKPILTSFLLYDSFYIIFYIGLKSLPYNSVLYHHLSVLYVINIDPYISKNLSYIIFLGEFTNIFMYNHYLLIQYSNTKATAISKKCLQISFYVEFFFYLSIRCFYFTYLIFQKKWRDSFDTSFYYSVFPIYIMGMMWSKNLIQQVKTNKIYNKNN